ncbi:hypothetical protein, partial [Bacillus safensis]|uniref:hypothetical protein n=1 Tax=Bacillus safensis TaxID=561879 RepID=UPI003857D0EC
MKKIIPTAFVLSTALLVAPGFSSAESSSAAPKSERVSLVNATGQKLAATQQTNGFTNLIPLPNNPNDLFPASTDSYVKDGNVVDYVYIDNYAKEDRSAASGIITSFDLREDSILVLPDGKVVHNGENKVVTIDNDRYEIKDNFDGSDQTIVNVKSMKRGQKLFTLGVSKKFMDIHVTPFPDLRGNVKVKAAYRWDLISQDLVGKNQGMSLSHSVTHGMSHEVSVGLSYTLGM